MSLRPILAEQSDHGKLFKQFCTVGSLLETIG